MPLPVLAEGAYSKTLPYIMAIAGEILCVACCVKEMSQVQITWFFKGGWYGCQQHWEFLTNFENLEFILKQRTLVSNFTTIYAYGQCATIHRTIRQEWGVG